MMEADAMVKRDVGQGSAVLQMDPARRNAVVTRNAGGALRRLRAFPLATAGVAAVEFALILPVMLMLYLGMAEVTQGVNINRKLTILSRTVADITSRASDGIDNNAMNDIFAASLAVMAPYDASQVSIRLTSVVVRDVNGAAVGEVCWSDGHLIAARAVGANVALPPGFNAPGSSFILAEVARPYTPTIGHAISGTINLSENTPWPVRNVPEVPRNGVTCL
ncbi:MAG: TadE/TadG family type IV pilus assembly protein [Salinarimonas sp.]